MRSRSMFRPVLVLLALTFGLQVSSHAAAVPNRITAAVNSSQMVALQGSVSPRLRAAVDLGEVSSAKQFTDLTLNFLPSAAQEVSLEALLATQQDPSSSNYHVWLTPAQYGAQFGMSDADLATVSAWLQGQGFTVGAIPASRNSIHFSGTAGQVTNAFHAEIHSYSMDGETHFANATEPSLPSAFAGVVSSIRGMSDFRAKAHLRHSANLVPYPTPGTSGAIKPNFVSSTGKQYLAPEDFAKIYDVQPLYNSGFNGSASFPIAVVGQTAVLATDISDFRSSFGLSSSNQPTMVLMPGTGVSAVNSTDDLGEAELDLEWSGAVAPSAPIYFIYTGNNLNYGVFDALQYAIQNFTLPGGKAVPIISNSYGECENSGDSLANFNTYESWFKQANAQGQTILSASGDAGAADCDNSTTAANAYKATLGLQVDYPASSAYVTGMGGSSFSADVSSNSTYWGTSNDAVFGNSLGLYIPSTTWNNTPTAATALSFKGLGAGGGGASILWAKPSWQTAVAGVPIVSGIPVDGRRDVPDISLTADPNHDGYLLCENGSCRANPATFSVVGGTSAAAPSFAGILALTEQRLGAAQGNINPMLYALAANTATYASAFHDITTGSNIVPCIVVASDTGCTSAGTMGFSAGVGYDQATGLGDVDANNLSAAFKASGLASTKALPAITLTAPSGAFAIGQSLSFTAAIAAGGGTGTPTGTVTFAVDGAAGSPITLTSSGSVSFSTTFTTRVGHTVTATYSGDGSFYGASTSTTINSFALSATNLTLTSGTSGTSTINVNSFGGYAGSVALTASTTSNTLASLASVKFALSPLTIAANGTATTTLTISTGATSSAVKGSLKYSGTGGVSLLVAGSGLTFAGLLFLGFTGKRRKFLPVVLSVFVFGILAAGTGCSSSSTTGTTTPVTSTSNVPAGTYVISVTGTDSASSTFSTATTLTLIVQ